MRITFPAPHAGPSPQPMRSSRVIQKVRSALSFRRLNAGGMYHSDTQTPTAWPRSPDVAPRLKRLQFLRPGPASAGEDRRRGMTGRKPARKARDAAGDLEAWPALPRFVPRRARLAQRFRPSRTAAQGRAAGLGQDGCSGSRRARPALPRPCVPSPASRRFPTRRTRRRRDAPTGPWKAAALALAAPRPSLALPGRLSPRPRP